jgi:hypothetical protein
MEEMTSIKNAAIFKKADDIYPLPFFVKKRSPSHLAVCIMADTESTRNDNYIYQS